MIKEINKIVAGKKISNVIASHSPHKLKIFDSDVSKEYLKLYEAEDVDNLRVSCLRKVNLLNRRAK